MIASLNFYLQVSFMSRITRLLPLALCLPLLAQAGVLDTYERETQKRREDGYRADAPNNPGSTPQVTQGFIDEMRRRTEPQGGQDISPATRAFMAEQEEKKRREAEYEKERERKEAQRRAQVQMDQEARLVRVGRVLLDGRSGNSPLAPAVYDRAMEVAWPDPSVMLRVARLAHATYPEPWRLRLGFLLSAGCDQEAQDSREQYPDTVHGHPGPEQYCNNTRYLRGYDVLKPLLKMGTVLERTLVCGLLYNWEGQHVVDFWYNTDKPRLAGKEAEITPEIQACVATLPAGNAFTAGLFEPLFLLGERDSRDISQTSWWPLFTPSTWEGVDLADAAAIRAVVERAAAESLGLEPKRYGWVAPPPQPPMTLLGATPEQVRKALGRPDKKVQRRRAHMPFFRERSVCLTWQDRGPLEAWAWGEKVKSAGGDRSYAVQWVVFNREGKACTTYNQTLEPRDWKAL
ncbi:MAG TPA: hypothetical protein DF427_07570 [Moraxellaceae bacterium]|nr:hypothetical protein [Moraxellaceae bacterium]